MTKLLLIPDVHGRKFWKDAIEKHFDECDKVIFLGDYLDAYPDEEITRKQEKDNFAEILKLKENNRITVIIISIEISQGHQDFHLVMHTVTRKCSCPMNHFSKLRMRK